MESGSMSSSASASMAGGGKRACRSRSSNALLRKEAAGGGSRRKNACFVPPLHSSSPRNPRSRHYGDRFIPNRSAMDLDMAQSLLTEPRKEKEKEKEKENTVVMASPAKEAYQKLLSETMMMNRSRILSFKNKPALQFADEGYFANASFRQSVPAKRPRTIPQSAERVLDAPDIIDDFYLNLLDWGSRNVMSIALENTVYLWNGSDGSISELVTVDEEAGPVTSVSWAADGRIIAVGLDSSDIQLWDSGTCRKLRTLRGVHRSRVGSLSWNKNILTTGGKDGKIVNNDVRVQSHIIQTYEGHNQEVCGLKWSGSGQLASGGNDNLVHIWDLSMASSNPPQNQWLHRFVDHRAAIKALAWCPFQSNILASGGGDADQSIKFWNTITGSCINSVHTGSQVCSLLWNKNERELVSSHGFSENQLTLWKYPSMVKIAQLTGHTSRVLYMTQSPDGCTVASAAGDETLRLWKVFGDPEVPKPAAKTVNAGPFANFSFIR